MPWHVPTLGKTKNACVAVFVSTTVMGNVTLHERNVARKNVGLPGVLSCHHMNACDMSISKFTTSYDSIQV